MLDDVPNQFEGAKMIRVNELYEKKELKFSVNQKINLYVAYPESKSSPVDSSFEVLHLIQSTDQKLSVLRVKPTDSPTKTKADLSIGYKIYMKSIPAGEVHSYNIKLSDIHSDKQRYRYCQLNHLGPASVRQSRRQFVRWQGIDTSR